MGLNLFTKFIDFTRCMRPDGTFYGTAGQCRKGREMPQIDLRSEAIQSKLTNQNLLGKGNWGKVYDIGNGIVVKTGVISQSEIDIMERLKNIPEVPRVLAVSLKDPTGNNVSMMAMTHKPGFSVNKLSDKKMQDVYTKLVPPVLNKIHKAGVAHNDLHGGNILYDRKNNKISIIDFGHATINTPAERLLDIKMLGVRGNTKQFIQINKALDRRLYLNKNIKQDQSVPRKQFNQVIDLIWSDIT